MTFSLFSRIMIGYLVALLLIIVFGIMNFVSTVRLSESYEKLDASKDRVLLLEAAASLVKDIQRAHRGFVVTRDKRFLDPYYNSLELIPSVKARLQRSNDWIDRSGIQKLTGLIDLKVELADHALITTPALHQDTVVQRIMEGKMVVDSINGTIALLERAELKEQKLIETDVARWTSVGRIIIVSGIATFIVLLLTGLLHLKKILTDRQKLYSDVKEKTKEAFDANEELTALNDKLSIANGNLSDNVRKLEKARLELAMREKELNHAQMLTRTGSFRVSCGVFTYSESYARIMGLKPDEKMTSFSDFLQRVHPDDREYMKSTSDKFLNDTGGGVQELRLLIDGKVKYIKAVGQLIEEDDKAFFLGAITDVTELMKAHEELSEANRKLLQSNSDLEAFTYSISHDLKAPVRSMLMYTHLLNDQAASRTDEEKTWLTVILRKAKHMSELIDGLLSLSRYGSLSLNQKEVNIAELVKDIIDELTRDYPTVEISLESTLGKVVADERMIRQVWYNLLHNACKFTSRVENPRIVIRRNDIQGFVEFLIRDNGIGFESEKANDLFTVFKRLHSTDDFSGSGVGLAIVKRIIISHGGEIEAVGGQGGAEFRFRLPRKE